MRRADLWLHGCCVTDVCSVWVPHGQEYEIQLCQNSELQLNAFDMAGIACSTFCAAAAVCGQPMSPTPVTKICCKKMGEAICMASIFGPNFCKQNAVL